MVGSVAQRLGRRLLADELSLSCARSMVGRWLCWKIACCWSVN